jgi:hypothetical protein
MFSQIRNGGNSTEIILKNGKALFPFVGGNQYCLWYMSNDKILIDLTISCAHHTLSYKDLTVLGRQRDDNGYQKYQYNKPLKIIE